MGRRKMLKLSDIDEDDIKYYKKEMGVRDGETNDDKIKLIEDKLVILIRSHTGAEKEFLEYLLNNLDEILFAKLSKNLLKEIKKRINKLYFTDPLFLTFSNLDSEESIYNKFFLGGKGKYSNKGKDLNSLRKRNMFLSDLKNRGIEPLNQPQEKQDYFDFREKVMEYLNFFRNKFTENCVIKSIEELFSYEKIRKIRHELINRLKIETCPYCLRNYSTNYVEKGENKTMADLDHYYPKSLYPYLALSLYNFIPSCLHCNRSLKKQKVLSYKYYPYSSIDNNIKFKYKYVSQSESLIEINSIHEQVNEDLKNLKLDLIYKTSHNNYVKNMLENFNKNPDTRLKDFTNTTGITEALLKEAVGKAYKFKIENSEPLGKLTKDILKQYGIEL